MASDMPVIVRRLQPDDAAALCAFYNGLSPASKRTFCPLQETTTAAVCVSIATDNATAPPTKYDLVAVRRSLPGAEELGEGNPGVDAGDARPAEEKIIGWSFLWSLDATDREAGPVFGLAVADAHHGQGLGTRLMSAVMAWARGQGLPQVILTVVTDNVVAQHLYEKQGFVRYGAFTGDDGLPYYRMRAEM